MVSYSSFLSFNKQKFKVIYGSEFSIWNTKLFIVDSELPIVVGNEFFPFPEAKVIQANDCYLFSAGILFKFLFIEQFFPKFWISLSYCFHLNLFPKFD